MPIRNDDPPPHEEEKLEAQLSAIRTAIDDSGVSIAFTESKEYENIIENVSALLTAAWADGYASGMSDEALANEARQPRSSLAPDASRPYRNIPLDKGDLDPS